MPNPAGKNQFGVTEKAYGDVKRQTQLTREAPMSGAPYSPLNAPQKLQRRAVRGGRRAAAASPQTQAPTPAPAPPTYPLGQVWSEIAQIPDVTPLALEFAQRSGGR